MSGRHIMSKCDICGYEGIVTEITKKHKYNCDFSYYDVMKVPIYLCEVCSLYVKRAKYITDILNKELDPLRDIINKVRHEIELTNTDIKLDVKHYIDTEFAKIRTDICRVLEELKPTVRP